MTVMVKGLTKVVFDEIMEFFNKLDERGYGFNPTYEQNDELFNIEFDMNDVMIVPVLDGIELQRRSNAYDGYYIDKADFAEIIIK